MITSKNSIYKGLELKAWAFFVIDAGVFTLVKSSNIASINRIGVGRFEFSYTIPMVKNKQILEANLTTSFTNAAASSIKVESGYMTTTGVRIFTLDGTYVVDPESVYVGIYE